MYDPTITDRSIDDASQKQGWQLERHSPSVIRSATAHFASLWEGDGQRLKRALTPDEKRFIQNERKVCALDFSYWWNYVLIVNWRKQPEIFKPNIAQKLTIDIWAEFERAGRAIHLQQLKARRLGVSTLSELAVLHRFQFHPYSNCVVASADPTKSVLMAEMIAFAFENQPWWLVPAETKVHKNIPAEFGEIHTGLTIQAGNQFNGVARGSTPNVIHASELAEWDDAESLVDAALYRAIIDTPDVFCVLESTAEGRGNWWHRTWLQNKKDWDRGRGRVRPVFLPWYVGTDLYPSETDKRARPVPREWQPSDRTIRHAERAREYVLNNPLLLKHLAKHDSNWQLNRDQLWFHEIEYETALEKKELNLWLSEMPADDVEAFQSDKISVIDQEIILNYRERTREPWGVFTILGEDIPTSLTVSRRYWDPHRQAITIRTTGLMQQAYTYVLQPLIWDGFQSAPDPTLRLIVWEPPSQDELYGLGVDTSDGVGQDNTVIEVLRLGTPGQVAAQVAEWASPYVKAFQLWPMCLAVGAWYSTFNIKAQRKAQCRIAIECRGNGEATQHELQKRGWFNFHPWKRYDAKRRIPNSKVNKIGVFTNQWWRSQMMDYILTLIDEESVDIPSPWLVDEMASIERDMDEQKAQAGYDEHDDRFMALGFILFSIYVDQLPQRRYTTARPPSLTRVDEPTTEQPYPVWRASGQGMDTAEPPSAFGRSAVSVQRRQVGDE